jgi:FAD/FMN-containing dehydrogenase/Fe-S oxidoreductase
MARARVNVRVSVDVESLRRELERQIEGEVRFDLVSRALYSTDASVYQMEPLGVVIPRSRDDLVCLVRLCARFRCPLTMRGGGTSQAGQAIGPGLIVDTSKYLDRVLELNTAERWVRVEPGIVLDELNAQLKPHGLRFAPDISTASRATIGGMMANNSSGARSVYYGKTIDHVLEQEVVLSDGSMVHFRALTPDELAAVLEGNTLESECYRVVGRLAAEHADEIERRFPHVLRRVAGYNLDEFIRPGRRVNLSRLMVGSEGTLGVVLTAKLNLVPLPRAKAVMTIQFSDLLESLAATPLILTHRPSAVEVMDQFILDHTRESPPLHALRQTFVDGDPGALLCVEFYADQESDLPPRLRALERDLRRNQFGYHYYHALDPAMQSRIWGLREAALGLSMTMKEDAKSLSFVEDTAVAPEKLRDYIKRFLAIIRSHGTSAGVYAHASVGCLHVRPVVNLKTEEGVRKFEAIANDVADLALEFGASLSGEHGDGFVRSPFMSKMFGPVLYEAFRQVKHTFDPQGIFNPGKIVDAPPLTSNLRYGAGYRTARPTTFFDFTEYGGMGGAVEMCSGLGVCRKKLDGTMCPSFMVTREEAHSTRGRANVLRLAMAGRLDKMDLRDQDVYDVLDLCLECRACKSECPVGVDVARFKSEFLADYWRRHGTPFRARALGNVHAIAGWGSRLAPVSNWMISNPIVRRLNQGLLGIDRRRRLPTFRRRTLSKIAPTFDESCDVVLFNDTFTNHCDPAIGLASIDVLRATGVRAGIVPHSCCGRPQISKGLLADARTLTGTTVNELYPYAAGGRKIVFCEPSCLSAMREDVPSLQRGETQQKARVVAAACVLFEELVETGARLKLKAGPPTILLHGHCHQKSMGLVAPARSLLSRIPGSTVVDLDAGCCGMAGSFGYAREHFEVSRQIGERRLLPAVRQKALGAVVVASGTSCRHQVKDFTGEDAVHPAILLRSLLSD